MKIYVYQGLRGSGKTTILKKAYDAWKRVEFVFGKRIRFSGGAIEVVSKNNVNIAFCVNCRDEEIADSALNLAASNVCDIVVVECETEATFARIKKFSDVNDCELHTRHKFPRRPVLPYSQDNEEVDAILSDLKKFISKES